MNTEREKSIAAPITVADSPIQLNKIPFFSRLVVKVILGLGIIIVISLIGFNLFYVSFAQQEMRKGVAENSVLIIQQSIQQIEDNILRRVEYLQGYANNVTLIRALEDSNAFFDSLEDRDAYIKTEDVAWVSAPPGSTTPVMDSVTNTESSETLAGIVADFKKRHGYPVFGEIFVTNKYGVNVAQSSRTSDYFQADEEWWRLVTRDGMHISSISFDESSGVYAIDVGIAIYDKDGTVAGVLKAVLDINETFKLIETLIPRDEEVNAAEHMVHGHQSHKTMNFTLVQNGNDIIYSTKTYDADTVPEEVDSYMLGQYTDGYFFRTHNGIDQLIVYAHTFTHKDTPTDKVANLDLTLFLEHDVTEVIQTTRDILSRFTLVVVGIFLLIFLISVFFITRFIIRPVFSITDATGRLARGDLSARAKVNDKSEIGQLGLVINAMAERLQGLYGTLEKSIDEKTETLSETLKKLEEKNKDLERAQMATTNLLEDLDEEKNKIEETVRLRTHELDEERRKLFSITEHMESGAILLDNQGQIVFVNKTMRDITALEDADGVQKIEEFFKIFDKDGQVRETVMRCVLEETSGIIKELEVDGRIYDIFVNHIERDPGQKNMVGTLIFVRDVTDATQLERSKSELVAVASHQLRTPLTAMRGNVEMLVDGSYGKLNKEQMELLDDVNVSTIRLITMVNEMLDITKIERGNLDLKLEELNLNEIIASVLSDLGDYAKRHAFTFTHGTPSEPAIVVGDRMRVRQICQNIIDNAIKYSRHPGTLEIAYAFNDKFVTVSFKDNGIGVPKVEQTKLFDRFYRASNTSKTSSSGSGLGLYIVKSIVGQLGGNIRFESVEDVGTTFFISLPKPGTHQK